MRTLLKHKAALILGLLNGFFAPLAWRLIFGPVEGFWQGVAWSVVPITLGIAVCVFVMWVRYQMEWRACRRRRLAKRRQRNETA